MVAQENSILSEEDISFIHRYTTGENANDDTAWRARFMMKKVLEAYQDGLINNSLVNNIYDPKSDEFRNSIVSLIKTIPGLKQVTFNSTDDEIVGEVSRMFNEGYKALRQVSADRKAAQVAPVSPVVARPVQQFNEPPVVVPFNQPVNNNATAKITNPFDDVLSINLSPNSERAIR
jgi:hypothetical protein